MTELEKLHDAAKAAYLDAVEAVYAAYMKADAKASAEIYLDAINAAYKEDEAIEEKQNV